MSMEKNLQEFQELLLSHKLKLMEKYLLQEDPEIDLEFMNENLRDICVN